MKSNLSLRKQNTEPTQLWSGYKKYINNIRKTYELNPNTCKNIDCQSPIPYSKKKNKFCCKKCSAIHNNKNSSKSTKRGPSKKTYPTCRVTFKRCKKCNAAFRFKKDGRREYCSDICFGESISKISKYRNSCKFNLNKNDHSCLFDSNLIEKYGWYSPSNINNNLSGVSWDHLYRVSDGFKNNIPFEVMKHPANAELVPHVINQKRRKSTITISELYDRIKLWDEGCRSLTRYHLE